MLFGQRWILALLLLCVAPAWAELQIEINQGVENPTPIAVVPFAWQGRWVGTRGRRANR